ncbi:MAG: phage head-tail connector protein [Acidobacteriaceae bacterium]
MNDIVLITPPTAEPVTAAQLMQQMGMGTISDPTLSASLTAQLTAYLLTARQDCENYCQRVFLTQHWLLRRDSFPGHNLRYEWNGYPQIELPKPPFQSVDAFNYIDVSGAVQALTIDTTYGTNPANPEYGYQLDRGSETQAARLLPPFARPWPPTRMVPANVMVQFRCGYGGPITATIAANSAVLSVANGITFNPDDVPLLTGDTGLPISIPGAGAGGATLSTFIASVDGSGNATLATAASTTVTDVPGWAGVPVPQNILQAILFLAQWYYEQASIVDAPMPRVVRALLDPYRNMVA